MSVMPSKLMDNMTVTDTAAVKNNVGILRDTSSSLENKDILLLRLPYLCITIILQYLSDDDLTMRELAIATSRICPDLMREIVATLHRRETSVCNIVLKADTLGSLMEEDAAAPILAKKNQLQASDFCLLNNTVGTTARAKGVAATFADGKLRDVPVYIRGGAHKPPPAALVNKLLDYYTEYIKKWMHFLSNCCSARYCGKQMEFYQIDLANLVGFAFWRMTWIHPFMDGNGRTAHVVAWSVADTITQLVEQNININMWPQWRDIHTRAKANVKFLEHRRTEERSLLLQALHTADDLWAAASLKEKQFWMTSPPDICTSKNLAPCHPLLPAPYHPPWHPVGMVFLEHVWVFKDLSRLQVHLVKIHKKMYRWYNDMGCGDYSTGLTEINLSTVSGEIVGETTIESSRREPKYCVDEEIVLIAWNETHSALYNSTAASSSVTTTTAVAVGIDDIPSATTSVSGIGSTECEELEADTDLSVMDADVNATAAALAVLL